MQRAKVTHSNFKTTCYTHILYTHILYILSTVVQATIELVEASANNSTHSAYS
jgi:hypothetical protein